MVISKEIKKLLDYRINQEELSWRIYLSMSIWLNFNGFFGAAKLWNKYAIEELTHADWVRDYLFSINLMPETQSIQEVQQTFKSLPNVVAISYQHELGVLDQCKYLANETLSIGDHATYSLAQKFVNEQIDELNKIQYWIDRLNAFGDSKESLFLLDKEMLKMSQKE